jgi:hypothetical protein
MWITRGGNIPSSETQREILQLAKEMDVELSVEEIMFGGME